MAGKRQRPIRRTVSASTMASTIFENSPIMKLPKETQKLPVLSVISPHGMLASTNPPKAPANSIAIANAIAKSEPPSQSLPLRLKLNNKPSSTIPYYSWNRSERKPVGLGVVAAFSDESRPATGVKDGENEAPPPAENISTMQPIALNSSHPSVNTQRRSAVFLHESLCKVDYEDRSSVALPKADFLEACYFCKRRLRHGFDIYMYRGDQAFCSEECRNEQIFSDESKEKRTLQALKMKTSLLPFRSTDPKTRCMVSGTTAAG